MDLPKDIVFINPKWEEDGGITLYTSVTPEEVCL